MHLHIVLKSEKYKSVLPHYSGFKAEERGQLNEYFILAKYPVSSQDGIKSQYTCSDIKHVCDYKNINKKLALFIFY